MINKLLNKQKHIKLLFKDKNKNTIKIFFILIIFFAFIYLLLKEKIYNDHSLYKKTTSTEKFSLMFNKFITRKVS